MTATPKTTPSYGKQWAWEHIDRWKRNGYGRDLSEQALKDLEMRAAAAMDSAFNAGVTSVSGAPDTPPESADESLLAAHDAVWPEPAYISPKDAKFMRDVQKRQACEHKGGLDTYQGKPFCKRCGHTLT